MTVPSGKVTRLPGSVRSSATWNPKSAIGSGSVLCNSNQSSGSPLAATSLMTRPMSIAAAADAAPAPSTPPPAAGGEPPKAPEKRPTMIPPGVVSASDSSSVPAVNGEKLSGASPPGGMAQMPPAMASAPMTSLAPIARRSGGTTSTIPLSEPSASSFSATMEASSL